MGLALGLTLGLIAFVRASMTPDIRVGNRRPLVLALVIAQSVAIICLWGTLVGSLLPICFKRAALTPAMRPVRSLRPLST